jgi:thioredoxin reductase (NADPH)
VLRFVDCERITRLRSRRQRPASEWSEERIARYGTPRHALAGELLYEQGTSGLGIHVILSGAVEIVRPGILGEEPITVQRAGEFTGEVNVLAGRRSLVRARMIEEGDTLVIDAQGLRRVHGR